MVVYGRACPQLRSRPDRRDQREYHYAGLGLRRCFDLRNHRCSIRKIPTSALEYCLSDPVCSQSALIYSRFGNGIATNNLSKMIAGLALPGRPVGNMYFAAWSHNVITNTVNLCNDLKMGEYLKIPPRVMFVTQIYGTILGGFLNYAVMISIVSGNAELLTNGNGNASWSGATIQSYNTNASSWALAKYLYKTGTTYSAVPIGVAVGAGLVVVHRIFVQVCHTIDLCLFRLLTWITVRPQDPQILHLRHQHASIHRLCWLYPLQPVPDLRHL